MHPRVITISYEYYRYCLNENAAVPLLGALDYMWANAKTSTQTNPGTRHTSHERQDEAQDLWQYRMTALYAGARGTTARRTEWNSSPVIRCHVHKTKKSQTRQCFSVVQRGLTTWRPFVCLPPSMVGWQAIAIVGGWNDMIMIFFILHLYDVPPF